MIDQKFDPLKAWKEVYDQTEKFWGKTLNETLNSEEYSAWMGGVLDLNLFYQKMMNDLTKGYLEKVNMPTQDDIARVASLVVNVENKVDNIEEFLEERVEALEASPAAKRDLAKVKNDLRALEAKVDQILEHLTKQQELLQGLQTREEKQ
ncbi:polyhydroxyalkanoic acid synthase subunit PhaR [Ectobacillus ponti]|uniref:Polyhydroxyalkanoic acid synthase subunit PhaR n=1 Tax=Ectobacillus ponti TaxID=2961894 RepID=A0AA41X3Z0_9BACI|nr:polyhydroxyalkanoic acid synthase subunit PhaR [Ectobacillus ponti]MCP8968511.1 polyhydroxyalkanoic acid synthase subunit PhaR [Ectobacillus ponti]